MRGAINTLLATTGTRTPLHLAAWAVAQRIVAQPERPSGALIVPPPPADSPAWTLPREP
ncbi:hypothetical protein ACIQF6_32580 [Kitasatospora sp. NPDC092948]|uniref:hypothetical protein n=1 Tax=Kitasatospora sp. NPDC092948 TaxID=3364088 RepID=UPI003818B53B